MTECCQISENEISKRDMFAAMALQGIIANNRFIHTKIESDIKSAVAYADALIMELRKQQDETV